MLELIPQWRAGRSLRVLCVGAHCDDIEIGCGATLLALQRRGRGVRIDWLVLGGEPKRREETRQALAALVAPRFRGELSFGDFRDGYLPAQYAEVKAFIERYKARRPTPDVIFCHEREDRHQDHRIVNEMVWNTWRDQLVLEYEIPKWDGGLGQPNVYMPVSRQQVEAKVRALLRAHRSQAARDWFTAETFRSLLRLRGLECRSPSGYAEAFHGRKIRIGAAP